MLGPHLLVSSVYEEGINTKDVYLPMSYQSQETHWCDVWTGQWYHGGRTVHIDVPLKQHGALFALQGALIPTGKCMQYVGAVPDDTRIFWCFPPPVSTEEGLFTSETVLTEDDGESMELITTEIHLTMTARKSDIDINIQILKSDFKLAYSSIGFLMPVGDKRLVKCKNGVRSFEASNGAMLHWTDL